MANGDSTNGGTKGEDIIFLVVSLLATAVFSAWMTSRYKDRAFKNFLKGHDKKTAERLSKQFNEEIEKIKEQCEEDKEEYKKRVIDLCRKYHIPPVV